MERQPKIKTKLSFSPNRTIENMFTMRARIGQKNRNNIFKTQTNQNAQNNRPFSQSAHKNKISASKMFSAAHKIDSKETYLLNKKPNKGSLAKESTNFASPPQRDSKANIQPSILKILRKRSSPKLCVEDEGKHIQRMVEIAITGRREDMPSQQKLMTTLSKIILGDERVQDDFYFQILSQSSIYGEEQNYIEMQSFILNGELLREETE